MSLSITQERELLELIAKAIGGQYCETSGDDPAIFVGGDIFHPLTEIADCGELAKRLNITVNTFGDMSLVTYSIEAKDSGSCEFIWFCVLPGQLEKVVCAVIVQAAAEIGMAMP